MRWKPTRVCATRPVQAILVPGTRRRFHEHSRSRRTRRTTETDSFIDGDIHPAFRQVSDLHPFLPARWREHLQTYGEHLRQGLSGQLAYPRMMASGMRADAFPEQGPPGSDLELMRSSISTQTAWKSAISSP
jgi:hypothetical protein